MKDELIIAALIGFAVFVYLLLGAVFANLIGVEETAMRLAVVIFWPIVLGFLVLLVFICIRIVGMTSAAIRGR